MVWGRCLTRTLVRPLCRQEVAGDCGRGRQGRPAYNGHEVGGLVVAENLAPPRFSLVGQDHLQSTGAIPLAHIGNGLGAHSEGRSDSPLGQFEQILIAGEDARRCVICLLVCIPDCTKRGSDLWRLEQELLKLG